MKKLIYLLAAISLLAGIVYATVDTLEGEELTDAANIEGVTTTDTVEGQVLKAAAGSECTGDIAFSWHAETLDLDTGTPASCTITTDKTPSLSFDPNVSGTQKHDGTNSFYIDDNGHYAIFDNTDNGTVIVDDDEGMVEFYVYVTTWADSNLFWESQVTNLQDEVYIMARSGGEVRITHEGQDAGATAATTTDANMSLNTWYRIQAQWRTADEDPNLWIQVCDTNDENCSTAATSNTNLTTWLSNPADFRVGNSLGGALYYYIDQVKVWNAWQN